MPVSSLGTYSLPVADKKAKLEIRARRRVFSSSHVPHGVFILLLIHVLVVVPAAAVDVSYALLLRAQQKYVPGMNHNA